MKVTLNEKDFEDIFLRLNDTNVLYSSQDGIHQSTHKGDFYFGKGQYTELYFAGVHISYGMVEVSKNPLIKFYSDVEVIDMHFSLRGSSTTKENHGMNINFGEGQHNVFYSNGFEGRSMWQGEPLYESFEVKLFPTYSTSCSKQPSTS